MRKHYFNRSKRVSFLTQSFGICLPVYLSFWSKPESRENFWIFFASIEIRKFGMRIRTFTPQSPTFSEIHHPKIGGGWQMWGVKILKNRKNLCGASNQKNFDQNLNIMYIVFRNFKTLLREDPKVDQIFVIVKLRARYQTNRKV